MLKQLVKDSAIYSAAAMLGQGMSLILLPFYTRVLSPADYGVVDILSVFSTLVYLTIALEISQGFCRHYLDAQTESDRQGYASTALWFTMAIYTLFVCAGILLVRPLATFVLDSSSDASIMRLAILAVWGHGPFSLILLLFRYQMQAIKYAIVNLTLTVITIATTIFLVLHLHLGIKGVICGGFVGQTVGAILALLIARQDYRLEFSRAKLMEMLKCSIPLVPSSIGVFGAQYIDRIVVKELLSFQDLGLFGIGYRMASPINLMMFAFASSLTPLIYTHYRQPETPGEIARIFRYFCALVFLSDLPRSKTLMDSMQED